MKSNQYWKDRANERMAEYHKNSDKTIFKINNAYDKAIEDINNDINKIFYKFATDGDLSEEDARILLNSKIPKKELDEIRAKINFIEDADLKKYLMSQLNSDAYKARITRLEALKESIYINTKKAADVELQQSQLGYINNIKESYYRSIYDIQKGTGIATDFATLPVNAIEEILKNNWSGKHYSERVWGNSDVLASKLEEVITSGLMTGKNSKKMAAELEELSTYGKMAAERLVRTETTYVTNMAELESYKELDIDRYIFVATLDLRTSPMCREMDGKIIEVSKGIPGENLPPLHPWCRSTKRAYFKGMTRRRRARDPETGKNYIVEDMDYKEWYQKCVVDKYGEQKAETFQKMIRNKASDRKQYERYREILGKDVPKSFTDFRELKYNDSEGWKNLRDKYRLDLNLWDDKKVSGNYQYDANGNRLAKIKEIKKIRDNLSKYNVGFIIDIKNKILPQFAAGGFNPYTGEVVLRENPTYLSLRHENFHAEQYIKLGKETYLSQTTLQREEYVYSQIMKYKEEFDDNEIYNAQYYIYTLRNGDYPPPNWKGY